MNTVTMERTVPAPPEAVRAAMADVEAFMRAGRFDDVAVDGDRIHLTNGVGLLTIELELRQVTDGDAAFAYEQVEGIFSTMETRFAVAEAAGGSRVTATTEFALDASLVGPILDATIITRQRRKELEGHFAYLESVAPA
jgi:hypothetical protein